MQLPQFFKKTSRSNKTLALSFLAEGIAIAISERQKDQSLKLIHAEFIACHSHEDQQTALNTLVTARQLTGSTCHLVLVNNDYSRLNIESLHLEKSEMLGAIRWKISELLDFSADNAAIAYYPAPKFTNNSYPDALEIIVCQQSVFQALTTKCQKAGLNLKVVDIQETCLRNVAVLLSDTAKGVAILHLQESFGTVLIQKEATIYVFRRFEIGYEQLQLNTSFTHGMASETSFNNLALEIRRSLDYVESYYNLEVEPELAVIPFDDFSPQLVTVLFDNYGIKAAVVDLSTLMDEAIQLDMDTQSMCAAVIGASLRDDAKTGYAQEINLYAQALAQPSKQTNLPVKSAGLSLLAVAILGYSFYLSRQQQQLEAQVKAIQKLVTEGEATLKTKSTKEPKIEVNPELEKEITQWQQALAELNQTVAKVSDKKAIQSQGFSAFFEALAAQKTADIWLTKLFFDGKQQAIKLEGATLNPQSLPVFLQALQQQPAFKGYSFSQLLMQRAEENPGQINFKLDSTLETEEDKETSKAKKTLLLMQEAEKNPVQLLNSIPPLKSDEPLKTKKE